MKFSLDSPSVQFSIQGYEPGAVAVGGKVYNTNVLVMPDWIDPEWTPQTIADLSENHVLEMLARKPELILIGTGVRQVFPPRRLFAEAIAAGVGYEIVSTEAACRTYNVVLAEGRTVLAGLILD